MFEMWSSGMQRADLSLGIPTYMGMHIPLGAQEVPAELPRSSEGQAFAAGGCQLHQWQQIIMFHLAW